MGGGAVARGRAGPGDSLNTSRGREEERRAGKQSTRACRPAGGHTREGVGVKRRPGPSGGAGESGRARAARPEPTLRRRGAARLRRARLSRLFLFGQPFPATSRRLRPAPRRGVGAGAAAWPAGTAESARPGP